MNVKPTLKPMPLRESILALAVFALLGLLSFYPFRHVLVGLGLNELQAYFLCLTPPMLVMLVWAWIGFRREDRQSFAVRFRLAEFKPGLLGWGLGLGVFMLAINLLYSPVNVRLIDGGILRLPAGIPAYLQPAASLSLPDLHAQFIASGAAWLIPLVLLLNIGAEELFWRGYMLPRQELTHGKATFLIHGTIWAVTHLFQYWLLPPILLSALAVAWLAQRTRSTWPGIIGHLFNNALPVLIILLMPA